MKLIYSHRYSALALIAGLAFAASPVHAGLVQVVSVAGIQSNDTILWSALGGDLTPLSPPVALTTAQGLPGTLSGSTAFTVFSGSTYNADFLASDFVVSAFDINTFTALASGIQINLPMMVLALGAQVQVNAFGPFSATLQAFDFNSVLLGSVSVNSSVAGNGDGSAVFLGARTTGNPIASIVVTGNGLGVALDTVSLQDVSAPEPSGFYLVIPALAAFVLRRNRGRR
jgi:hypothetical protein